MAVAVRSLSDVGDEVTMTQYRTLVILASRGPQRLSDLAQAVGVTPATASRMCDRLVRKRLILRRTRRDDRRNVRISLSAAGRAIVDAVTLTRRREISRIVTGISPDDQETFVRVLRSFAAAAGEVPAGDWPTGWEI